MCYATLPCCRAQTTSAPHLLPLQDWIYGNWPQSGEIGEWLGCVGLEGHLSTMRTRTQPAAYLSSTAAGLFAAPCVTLPPPFCGSEASTRLLLPDLPNCRHHGGKE